MAKELKTEETPDLFDKGFALLASARVGQDVTVRDDQHEFSWILDAIRSCRRAGGRFRLVDSGGFDAFQLEWLGEAGADIYTSDRVGRGEAEVGLIVRACRRGRSIAAHLHHGDLVTEGGENPLSIAALGNLGEDGLYLHLSNRETKRDFPILGRFAGSCRKGGSRLVYYHHGGLDPEMKTLAESGAWMHFSDEGLRSEENRILSLDIIRAARSNGAGIIIHMEKKLEISFLWDFLQAGAFVLFKTRAFDYRSPFKALEEEAGRNLPDFRAFFLSPAFIL